MAFHPKGNAHTDEPTITVDGVVEHFVTRLPDSGFAVMRVRVDTKRYPGQPWINKKRQATFIGDLCNVQIGDNISAAGTLGQHPQYGYQIRVQTYRITEPTTTAGIVTYLRNSIKQIGPILAQRIVDLFGEKTLEILDENPDRLDEVSGVHEKRIAYLKEQWASTRALRHITLFLSRVGLGDSFAARLLRVYGQGAIEVIQKDPYKLARDVEGIGFIKADEVARRLGVDEISPLRITAAMEHILRDKAASAGDCFQYESELLGAAGEILNNPAITLGMVRETLQQAVATKTLVIEDNRVYLPNMAKAEAFVAEQLRALLTGPLPGPLATADADKVLEAANKAATVTLDPVQAEAVATSLRTKVSIITGGPGTGKTTITRCVVAGLKLAGVPLHLLAPTGRAAKRMAEVIGEPAQTIHRLCFQLRAGIKDRAQNGGMSREDALAELQLDNCAIVIDEFSMVDVYLLQALLTLLGTRVTIVIVGDVDQLPSVGPGALLRDAIDSGQIPCTRLATIHRQAQNSDIKLNAHRINRGEMPLLHRFGRQYGMPHTDMFAVVNDDEEHLAKATMYCATHFARHLGLDPAQDCHVLAPMYRGACGVARLNNALQEALNPKPADSFVFGRDFPVRWGLGDKLMQTKNDYKLGIFNGDLGVVTALYRDEEGEGDERQVVGLRLRVDEREIDIDREFFPRLQLAYCSTVHKAQGGQFPMVIMVLHTSHFVMLQRNLLYTGLTRAQRFLVLCCNEQAVIAAVRNNRIARRNTYLAERLRLPAA